MKSFLHRTHSGCEHPDPEATPLFRVVMWMIAVAGVVVIFWIKR